MIRLHHVDKYFNRKKKNEIHVINDTSLSFEERGMVGLLGPSGCGKTTLLNVIGGLDSVQSGDILVNGERITKRRSGRIDEIRNLNVGYIFQNYNLVDEMTVFDNVAIVLKMIGVKSKSEIKTKVNYALQIVGMYRYRNRFADMLSGGERQRVAIARAIVKNPPVIIADEPTGNLDSKNTLEVMNIIKAISRNRLVILVTHEEELANFYCNRIVRIRDGRVISDEANDKADRLDYRIDNNIYLDDLPHHKSVKETGYNIDLYSDSQEDLDLKVVVQKGNIYVQSGDESNRMEVVDDDSSIELIDGSYRQMSQEDFLKHRYDAKKLAHRRPPRYTSIIGIREMIKSGFQKVMDYKILKKILLVGFFLSAIFILYAVSNAAGVSDIQDSKFVTVNKDYLKVVNKKVKVADYEKYENLDSVVYVIPGSSVVNLNVPYDEYFQTNGRSGILTGSLTSVDLIGAEDLIRGRMPKTQGEMVVDKLAIKNMQKNGTAKQAGLSSVKDFLGKKVKAGDTMELTIVGITDRQEPCIYTDPVCFMDVISGGLSNDQAESINESWGDIEDTGELGDDYFDDEEYGDDGTGGQLVDYHNYNFDGGIQPTKDYECLVNASQSDEMPLGKTIDRKVNGKKLKVIGYYTDKDDSSFLLVNTNTWRYSIIEGQSGVTVYATDKDAATAELQELGVNVENTYDKAKKKYVKGKRRAMRTALIMAAVVLIISLVEIFLIMRASFLSRVKEVGVFRAIGVKKRDIYKMFAGEIIAITVITGIPGIAFASYIVYKLSQVEMLSGNYLINAGIVLLAFALTTAFNLFFGLIPVFRTLRKTPAAILARTDVNN